MLDLGARCVFFVQDTPRAMEYYTHTLGFHLDWTHEEHGRPYVAQVSLLGLQIILNQIERPADGRAGHGRLFVGLEDDQTAALMEHIRTQGVPTSYTHWGAPTLAIHDLDGNELYFWLCDAERAKWQQAHEGSA
jgi:catechol 2,3-dioxygenase-like lactoylglutathione lyase family enzyme